MAEPAPIGGVYALPPGIDFGAALLRGLEERAATRDPLWLARAEVWVNTVRTQRHLTALLEARPVALAPQIRALAQMPEDVLGLPPPRPPLELRLELARLVRALLDAAPDAGGRAAAYPLAESLDALLGEMEMEGVPFATLAALDAPDAAGHWQRALRFLSLLGPLLDAPETAPAGPDRRLALAMAARARGWAACPPDHAVIVAGSTGSRGATAQFMAAVAALPNGATVLPGWDAHLPGPVWADLADPAHGARTGADHPQFGLARLCARLGQDASALPLWTEAASPSPDRARLVSLALRPAPVTDQWRREGPALKPALPGATGALTLLEAPDPATEALAIAIAMRRAVADGVRIALITPDRTLARRVTAALDRWRIAPDDSAGRPLDLTPPGTFLRLTARLLTGPADPVTLLSVLKHPLAGGSGPARGLHLGLAAGLEAALRGGGPVVTGARLDAWAAEAEGRAPWVAWLGPVVASRATGERPLPEILADHLALAETLAEGVDPTAPPADLWGKAAGEAARARMDALAEAAPGAGALLPSEYPALLRGVLAGVDVPEDAYEPHPLAAIWGTLEARAATAPRLILAGLNDGTWPQVPPPDPWLSREMRAAVGLPLPERRIGLSAHDFQQAINGADVVLSRSTRSGEAPTVPSRWLLRLTNLIDGVDPGGAVAAMRARGDALLAEAAALTRVAPAAPARRPAPVPPAAAFPARLSVTAVERLVRDPYEVYARHILHLRPAEPLARAADPALRGSVFHAILAQFVARTQGWPAAPEAVFEACLDAALEAQVPWAAARVLWKARLTAAMPWFLETEADRRNRGRPLRQEAEGALSLDGLTPPITLTARADRIDLTPDGQALIYDYKSGQPPSKKEAAEFHKQLPLEAAMALRAGFEGLSPAGIAGIELLGLAPGSKPLALDPSPEALQAVWAEVQRLLAAYQSGAPFRARTRPQFLRDVGDYDHLSRRGEWLDGDPAPAEALP